MNSSRAVPLLNFGIGNTLPVLRQTENTECGPACIAMIASFHGHTVSVAQLRHRFGSSSRGNTLKDLAAMAEQMGLVGRSIRLEMSSIGAISTPCVLHWGMNHFVVLKSVGPRYLVIHDPARGQRKISHTQAANEFTGVALELAPGTGFKQQKATPVMPLHALWSGITGFKRSLAVLLGLSLLLQFFAVASPFYVQTVVDDVVLRSDIQLLKVMALGFGLLLLIELGSSALRSFVILHLASRMNFQLARNLLRHLLRLPLAYFSRRHLGDILSRFSSVQAIKDALSTSLVGAIVDGVMACATLAAMVIYDIRLSLIVLTALLFYTLIKIASYSRMRQLTEETITTQASSDSHLIESIRAIATLKLFQRERDRQQQWEDSFATTLNKSIALSRLEISLGNAAQLVSGLENLLVVYFAACAVIDNTLTLGMFFAFMSYKSRFSSATQGFVDQALQLKMLNVHLERISDIAYTSPDPASEIPLHLQRGTAQPAKVEACSLSFSHGNNVPLFSDINFSVPAGSSIAITGESGCGKSTLLKCLMGLLTAQGKILLDGQPLERILNYRSRIAAVLQDDLLLSGSIGENISCFDPAVDIDKTMRCARLACIHEDIAMMPMQYNTRVGDMGSTLSGGQVQRIMLARAFYREPDILFLDEATCHLDIETEAKINAHLSNIKVTRVYVAHRPEAIAQADQQLRLQRPR